MKDDAIFLHFNEKTLIKDIKVPPAHREGKVKQLLRCWTCKDYIQDGIKRCNCPNHD